jgi:hypothetical protein
MKTPDADEILRTRGPGALRGVLMAWLRVSYAWPSILTLRPVHGVRAASPDEIGLFQHATRVPWPAAHDQSRRPRAARQGLPHDTLAVPEMITSPLSARAGIGSSQKGILRVIASGPLCGAFHTGQGGHPAHSVVPRLLLSSRAMTEILAAQRQVATEHVTAD